MINALKDATKLGDMTPWVSMQPREKIHETSKMWHVNKPMKGGMAQTLHQ